jgi:hypothetical protein
MTNLELKAQLIAKLQNDPKIWRAEEMKYKDNAQVQRQAKEVYAEVISRLCAELEK